jgi:hypothetical protein
MSVFTQSKFNLAPVKHLLVPNSAQANSQQCQRGRMHLTMCNLELTELTNFR